MAMTTVSAGAGTAPGAAGAGTAPGAAGAGAGLGSTAPGAASSSMGPGSETTWTSPSPIVRVMSGTASAATSHSHSRTPCSRACPSAWPSLHPVPSGRRSWSAVVVARSASAGSSTTCLTPRSPHRVTPASSRIRAASIRRRRASGPSRTERTVRARVATTLGEESTGADCQINSVLGDSGPGCRCCAWRGLRGPEAQMLPGARGP